MTDFFHEKTKGFLRCKRNVAMQKLAKYTGPTFQTYHQTTEVSKYPTKYLKFSGKERKGHDDGPEKWMVLHMVAVTSYAKKGTLLVDHSKKWA